jgi:hypothetical protein
MEKEEKKKKKYRRRINRNRRISEPEHIEPSQEEYDHLRDELTFFYQNMPGFKGDPLEKAVDVLEKCKKGWRNCPIKYVDRVRSKSKWNHGGGQNLLQYGFTKRREGSREKALEQIVGRKPTADEIALEHVGRDQILKTLKQDDRNFWLEREIRYREEFDFNNSSDYALLMEVLSDEVEHKRIIQLRLKTTDPKLLADLSRAATECFNRLERALKALGVTRDQRKGELDDSGEDVASLAAKLDEKERKARAFKEYDAQEREEYLRRKSMMPNTFMVEGLPRPVHNRIPDMKEILRLEREAGRDSNGGN